MMKLLPDHMLETLEFDKVLRTMASYCLTPMASKVILETMPTDDREHIQVLLDRVSQTVDLQEQEVTLLRGAFEPGGDILRNLRVPGYMLEGHDIMLLRDILYCAVGSKTTSDALDSEQYGAIKAVAAPLVDFAREVAMIDRILQPDGSVRDDASPELKKIAREVNAKRIEVDRVFQAAVRKYSDQGWLAETLESVRNGRRVLSGHNESKRRIRGIIHDQSTTGRTFYVEPEEVIELNNDIIEMLARRKAEEYRLLRELCESLRPVADEIENAERILIELDCCSARARFATATGASRPGLRKQPHVCIVQGVHPLLLLKNLALSKVTVPFDLELDRKNRILLLSGPNAGGKSILLKSVGLLQIMVQSGLLVPCRPESEFGIFRNICVDMGDRQSIEDDLSTYSSRLMSLKSFIDVADKSTLLLIDEFGSGTDPKLGGAIAEAALNDLNASHVCGVITTHYSELKLFAHDTDGIINGAMVFDRKSMRPTYRLSVGKPGSSFAFEIAHRSGLSKEVIQYAKNKAGKHTRAMEDLIGELESQKYQLAKERRTIDEQKKLLDRLTASYDHLQNELTAQRKRMRLEQKERDYQHLSNLNRELERAVKKARETQNVDEIKKQLQRVKENRGEAREKVVSLQQELKTRRTVKKQDWQAGDPVRIAGTSQAGQIESVDKKYANVIVGQLRIRVPLDELEPAGMPININPSRSVTVDTSQQIGSSFNKMLDIRGMRVKNAMSILERFLDSALLSGVGYVEIVHGKGTGALRKIVEDKLKEYPVTGIDTPEDEQGGSGVTVVRF